MIPWWYCGSQTEPVSCDDPSIRMTNDQDTPTCDRCGEAKADAEIPAPLITRWSFEDHALWRADS